MGDMVYTQEYADEQTGIRMTVERDGTDSPKVTIFPPEPCTLEPGEIYEALQRLLEVSAVVVYQSGQEEDEQ